MLPDTPKEEEKTTTLFRFVTGSQKNKTKNNLSNSHTVYDVQ